MWGESKLLHKTYIHSYMYIVDTHTHRKQNKSSSLLIQQQKQLVVFVNGFDCFPNKIVYLLAGNSIEASCLMALELNIKRPY